MIHVILCQCGASIPLEEEEWKRGDFVLNKNGIKKEPAKKNEQNIAICENCSRGILSFDAYSQNSTGETPVENSRVVKLKRIEENTRLRLADKKDKISEKEKLRLTKNKELSLRQEADRKAKEEANGKAKEEAKKD